MRCVSNTWAVVLAGGEGSRFRDITTTATGEVVPKQFCSLRRETCLLEDAIKRAQAVATRRHTCSVVAAQHRRLWGSALRTLPAQNIFVQPKNRGTAHGILFALLQIELEHCRQYALQTGKRTNRSKSHNKLRARRSVRK
jgi:mannose-1-phosphate guanylyltransferase